MTTKAAKGKVFECKDGFTFVPIFHTGTDAFYPLLFKFEADTQAEASCVNQLTKVMKVLLGPILKQQVLNWSLGGASASNDIRIERSGDLHFAYVPISQAAYRNLVVLLKSIPSSGSLPTGGGPAVDELNDNLDLIRRRITLFEDVTESTFKVFERRPDFDQLPKTVRWPSTQNFRLWRMAAMDRILANKKRLAVSGVAAGTGVAFTLLLKKQLELRKKLREARALAQSGDQQGLEDLLLPKDDIGRQVFYEEGDEE